MSLKNNLGLEKLKMEKFAVYSCVVVPNDIEHATKRTVVLHIVQCEYSPTIMITCENGLERRLNRELYNDTCTKTYACITTNASSPNLINTPL